MKAEDIRFMSNDYQKQAENDGSRRLSNPASVMTDRDLLMLLRDESTSVKEVIAVSMSRLKNVNNPQGQSKTEDQILRDAQTIIDDPSVRKLADFVNRTTDYRDQSFSKFRPELAEDELNQARSVQ
jgi:hypothetical protein